jgi:hypothetical protein
MQHSSERSVQLQLKGVLAGTGFNEHQSEYWISDDGLTTLLCTVTMHNAVTEWV